MTQLCYSLCTITVSYSGQPSFWLASFSCSLDFACLSMGWQCVLTYTVCNELALLWWHLVIEVILVRVRAPNISYICCYVFGRIDGQTLAKKLGDWYRMSPLAGGKMSVGRWPKCQWRPWTTTQFFSTITSTPVHMVDNIFLRLIDHACGCGPEAVPRSVQTLATLLSVRC